MKLQAGIFLKSTDALNDTLFSQATIFITEYDINGAVGFVSNQPLGRYLNELEEFKNAANFPLYTGGPVDKEHLFFLHQRPDLIDEGTLISNGIYLGGNFKQAVTCINNKTITSNHIKIFVGYCGWDAGELEAEIEEGSWVIIDEANKSVFG
jgi:putative transcriptional regulator